MRLISLCPSNTEIIDYLGLTDQLVGVDNYSDWPEETKHLPRLGPDLSINMDKVEQLSPDLVIASLSVPGMEKNIEQLKQRNIPYIVLNPNSLFDITESIEIVGKATNRTEKAKEVAEKFRSFLYRYQEFSETVSKQPSIYWEWWPKPIFTPGKRNWLTEISELAGGRNIFIDKNVSSVQTDWTDVVSRKPDYICLVWVGVQTDKIQPSVVLKREQASTLPAIQMNHIHILEESLFCRPSPRILLGLKKLAATINPKNYPIDDGQDPLL